MSAKPVPSIEISTFDVDAKQIEVYGGSFYWVNTRNSRVTVVPPTALWFLTEPQYVFEPGEKKLIYVKAGTPLGAQSEFTQRPIPSPNGVGKIIIR